MTIRSRAWATGDGGDVTLGRAHACAETTAPSQRGSSLWGTGLSVCPEAEPGSPAAGRSGWPIATAPACARRLRVTDGGTWSRGPRQRQC